MMTELKEVIEEFLHVPQRVTRNANIFEFTRHHTLPLECPLRIAVQNVNAYRYVIKIDDSIGTNK